MARCVARKNPPVTGLGNKLSCRPGHESSQEPGQELSHRSGDESSPEPGQELSEEL